MERYDPWLERLSEYLDGDLEAADHAALETHLAECADCRETLDDLIELVALAGQLEDREPEHDLWPAIRDRVRNTGSLGVAPSPDRHRAPRRVSFSLPQLAAACIACTLLAGGTVWFLGAPRERPLAVTDQAPVLVTPPAVVPESAPIGAAATPRIASTLAATQYDSAIADLERILAEGRDQLAPVTIAILEKNLAIIDQAIDEARSAVAADPANLYLTNYLADTMKRKLELLRYTTSIVRAQS